MIYAPLFLSTILQVMTPTTLSPFNSMLQFKHGLNL